MKPKYTILFFGLVIASGFALALGEGVLVDWAERKLQEK